MAEPGDVVEELRRLGVGRGALLALALQPGLGLGLGWGPDRPGGAPGAGSGGLAVPAGPDPIETVRVIEEELRPRWVWWSNATAVPLVAAGLRLGTCWDLAAVHRLLAGGWAADPARVWAHARGLTRTDIPQSGPVDLFHQPGEDGDPEEPVRADGHLRPDWAHGGVWSSSTARLARWAALAAEVQGAQQRALEASAEPPLAMATARSESAAELLCAELAAEGLPVDRAAAEAVVAGYVGPRARTATEAAEQRQRRDADVLRHLPPGGRFDLRSPGQVRSLLRFVGVEVPDTRAWRLEAIRDAHPVVDALLAWRKAERVATTFGYGWLDEHVDDDGRLRGEWTGCDGAAGRMTASAGLHNMPADLRGGVVAEPGRVFVRADLGQIEPRVLAAVSGDRALARAARAADLYAPVAAELGVDRATAKVAVLGAMYGQTTGHGAQALRGLQRSYPVAMGYLEAADREAQAGRDLHTYGGRRLPMGGPIPGDVGEREGRSRAAARGRYGRNALVQGAAAELFKVWAVTVRARAAALDARIVLCLHDELLVHAPVEQADAVAAVVDDALQEAAARWAPSASVRFLAETSIIARWADAKG